MNTSAESDPAQEQPAAWRALLRAAEQLVAQHGARGFTMKELMLAANSRNISAVYYHFGSRERLIRAVAEHGMAKLNARRLALLELTDPNDARGLVEALILPLSEQIMRGSEPSYHARFQERIARGGGEKLYADLSMDVSTGWLRCEDLLRAKMSHLPPRLIEHRIVLGRTLIKSGLADIEAVMEREKDPAAAAASVVILVDALVATLMSPPSAKSLDLI